MGLEFAQRVQQMGLVPDQHPVQAVLGGTERTTRRKLELSMARRESFPYR